MGDAAIYHPKASNPRRQRTNQLSSTTTIAARTSDSESILILIAHLHPGASKCSSPHCRMRIMGTTASTSTSTATPAAAKRCIPTKWRHRLTTPRGDTPRFSSLKRMSQRWRIVRCLRYGCRTRLSRNTTNRSHHVVNQRETIHNGRQLIDTHFAASVGPTLRSAKLLGKSGFPGPRSLNAGWYGLFGFVRP